MGHLHAREIASIGNITLEEQIRWHLMSNHFPPIPESMVEPCIQAIDAFFEDNLDKLISLPEGVGYKGLTVAPARAILVQHHLEAWCEEPEEFED